MTADPSERDASLAPPRSYGLPVETVRLAQDGERRGAVANVLANLLLGTAAAAAGLALAGVL